MQLNIQSSPLVSVIITSYNREFCIEEAIQSVLNSSFDNYELIIVDDSSTDNTQSIIFDYSQRYQQIRFFKNPQNLGEYENRNLAASYASGKYIKYLDSDDVMSEDCLEIMVDRMEKHPEAAIGLLSYFDESPYLYEGALQPDQLYQNFYFKGNLINCGPSSTIIRKDIFELLGRYNIVPYLSDVDFIFRISSKYPAVIFSKKLISWRRHPNQEYAYGLSTGFYENKTFGYFKFYLENESNPMSPLNTKMALRNLKNRYCRNIIKKFLSFEFKRSIKLFNIYELTLLDLVHSFKPNTYPKTINY
jgi:glycosyltransferase involved in cell wall biosynthesis